MPNLEAEIVFEGGMKVPVTCKVDTLADVGRLGQKLIATARGAVKLIPALKQTAVKSVKISTAA
jgi:hypothetical protein